MKRYIRCWYVGEPETYTTTKHGEVRSYFENPKDWKSKQSTIFKFMKKFPSVQFAGSSPWVVNFRIPGENDIFSFDLWEDDESIEQQMQHFADIASTLEIFPYKRHAKSSDEEFSEFYSNLTSEQCTIVDNIADDLDIPDYEFCSEDQLNILYKLSVKKFKQLKDEF